MSDTLRDEIITSPTAKRMLERVSPIYDDSYVGLWMFQVIGLAYDEVWDKIYDLPNQLYPETATWAIELWEERYGITPDDTLSIEERRRKVIRKRTRSGAFTPKKIEALAENMTGFPARVVENVAPYTFAVYLSATTSDDDALRSEIKRLKPSHCSFEIRYEQSASCDFYMGGVISQYKDFALAQVN